MKPNKLQVIPKLVFFLNILRKELNLITRVIIAPARSVNNRAEPKHTVGSVGKYRQCTFLSCADNYFFGKRNTPLQRNAEIRGVFFQHIALVEVNLHHITPPLEMF